MCWPAVSDVKAVKHQWCGDCRSCLECLCQWDRTEAASGAVVEFVTERLGLCVRATGESSTGPLPLNAAPDSAQASRAATNWPWRLTSRAEVCLA